MDDDDDEFLFLPDGIIQHMLSGYNSGPVNNNKRDYSS